MQDHMTRPRRMQAQTVAATVHSEANRLMSCLIKQWDILSLLAAVAPSFARARLVFKAAWSKACAQNRRPS
jgi:hypothetical protein